MYYTIYKVTNNINGKIYIGKHQTNQINDSYYGSGKAIKNAIKKHGKENFIKEILYVFNTEHEMNAKEKEIITEEFVSRLDTYNAGVGGEGGPHFKGKLHSSEAIKKRTESRKDFKLSVEARQKISEANRRRGISDETKRKLSEKAKQRTHSEETKQKLREIAAKRKLTRGSERV